jgi:hypothetical protein
VQIDSPQSSAIITDTEVHNGFAGALACGRVGQGTGRG